LELQSEYSLELQSVILLVHLLEPRSAQSLALKLVLLSEQQLELTLELQSAQSLELQSVLTSVIQLVH
jgi:hypothetical protein